MVYFLQLLLTGFVTGAVYSLVALGFVIIYKCSSVLNFAQGQMLMVGAFATWAFLAILKLPIGIGILLGLIVAAIMGWLINRLTIRPLIGQPLLAIMMMTLGLGILLDAVTVTIFGGLERAYPEFIPITAVNIGPLVVSQQRLCCCGVALLLFGLFTFLFHRTRIGLSMRAVAEGHDVARSLGIRVGNVFTHAWVIAAISATVGGILLGSINGVSMGLSTIGLKIFPVVLVGGLQSIPGCIVAGPLIGVLETLAAGYLDPFTQGGMSDVMPFLVMIAILFIKPYGFFGEVRIERI